MIQVEHKNVIKDALPKDLEQAYLARDLQSIRLKVHELIKNVLENQSDFDFHHEVAKLYVAIALFDSLSSRYGVTTMMTDYINV